MLSAAIRMPTFLIAKPSNTCTSARALLPAVGGLAVLVVLETDKFHQIGMAVPVRTQQSTRELQSHWLGQRSRVLDGEDVFDTPPVRPRPALDRVQLPGVRCAAAVGPEVVVVAVCIDTQPVPFP